MQKKNSTPVFPAVTGVRQVFHVFNTPYYYY